MYFSFLYSRMTWAPQDEYRSGRFTGQKSEEDFLTS